MTQHTAGPWFFDETRGDRGLGPKSKEEDQSYGMLVPVAYIEAFDYPDCYLANARLITSAPMLLEALRELVRVKAPVYHDCTDNGESECEWCIARSAIKAATGEQHG